MSARKAPDLTTFFSAAKQSQHLSEAESEIQEQRLKNFCPQGSTELEEQLQALRAQLQLRAGVLSIL